VFELPEVTTLASQANATLQGRIVATGSLGNRPHKFVWYNRTPDEFAALVAALRVGEARARGKWLFIPLEPGYVLLFGECGGRFLFHDVGAKVPEGYHLKLTFEDGSALTVMTAMWGAMELHEVGRELDRQFVRDMRPTPVEAEFTFAYFDRLVDATLTGQARSVKGLLTQDQLVPGVGNAIAQDICFRARLHPRHPLATLDADQRRALFDAVVSTIRDAIAHGGRSDETDLLGRPGGYVRRMDKSAVGRPCADCGTTIVKLQYLGGACYVCPACQL
jgi:formamidopyrimidine-DNA glycosylase